MDSIINIRDLIFKQDDRFIFKGFNLNIKRDSFTTIVGPNGGGKSTLVRILCGLEKFDGYINIDGISLTKENLNHIKMKIGIVFETNDQAFVAETVTDEMAFILENLCYPKKKKKKEINWVSTFLNLKDILNKDPNNLNDNDKQLVSLACILVNHPKVIIIDETLDMVDNKELLFQKLKTLKDTTIINITHDLSDALYSDEIIVLASGKVILQGDKKTILKQEEILNKNGLQLPFIIDLSLKLKYYDLVDEIIFTTDEMVDKLWK